MSTFVVVLDREGAAASSDVLARLREAYKDVHPYTPTCILVSADALTEDVAEAGGIKGDDRDGAATGAVFRINGYSGYTNRSLWEWIAKVGV